MQSMPKHTSSLISVDMVLSLLDDKPSNLKLLFTSMDSMASNKPASILALPHKAYLPNSIMFDFTHQICDHNSTLSNMMPSMSQFTQQVRELGINHNDTLIVYDDFGNFCASRVWFMFKTMGFDNIFVMDGGLPAWLDAKLMTTEKLLQPTTLGNFFAKKSEQIQFVNSDYVKAQLSCDKSRTVDARGRGRFNGTITDPRPGVRSGHIPNSENVHYATLQTSLGTANQTEIKNKLTKYGDLDEVIFSCGSGVTACILALYFYELDPAFPRILVYDGSWSQWGSDITLLIETSDDD